MVWEKVVEEVLDVRQQSGLTIFLRYGYGQRDLRGSAVSNLDSKWRRQ